MNIKQKNRLLLIISLICILSVSAALVLYALKQNINLFYTPTQLVESQINPEQAMRIGGLVKKHSVHYNNNDESVSFLVTDNINDVLVSYHGILPNLFREGQGVVITGKLNSRAHVFFASEVLAKHDEKYMPLKIGAKHDT